MTDRIAEITARCEVATPGPWEWRYNSRNDYGVEAESLKGVITLEDIYPGYPECGEHLIMDIGTPDADFIAQSREDVPYLLSQLAERDKELKRLQKEVASLAIESVKRDVELARLEAEVMVWAKAEQEKGCPVCVGKYADERVSDRYCNCCGKRLEVEP